MHLLVLIKAFCRAERIKPFQVAKRHVFKEYGLTGSKEDIVLTALMYRIYTYEGILDKVVNKLIDQNVEELPCEVKYLLRMVAYFTLVDKHPSASKMLRFLLGYVAPQLARAYGWRQVRLAYKLARKAHLKSLEEVVNDREEIEYLLPRIVIDGVKELLDSKELKDFSKALLTIKYYGFRVNTLKANVEEVIEELKKRGVKVWKSSRVENYVWYQGRIDYDRDPLITEGKLVPQDEAAVVAGFLLGVKPGMTVVDLCAAPGGKTTHIAELMRNRGTIIAFDVWSDRMSRLIELARRTSTYISIYPVLCDGRRALRLIGEGKVDRVLVDPPCSSTGVLYKHPDARWRLTKEKLEELTRLQKELLYVGFKLLKKGGLILYTVCSVLPQEGEYVVKWLLERETCAEIIALRGPYDPSPLLKEAMRSWPHRHGVGGFFYALIRKRC